MLVRIIAMLNTVNTEYCYLVLVQTIFNPLGGVMKHPLKGEIFNLSQKKNLKGSN